VIVGSSVLVGEGNVSVAGTAVGVTAAAWGIQAASKTRKLKMMKD
jgi:hypothetical protein